MEKIATMENTEDILELLKDMQGQINRLETEVQNLRKEVENHDIKSKIRTDRIISYCSDYAYDATDEKNI